MGYYTSYGLVLEGEIEKCNKFEKDLLKESEYKGAPDSSVQELITEGGTYAKLYDIEEWIGKAAKKNPDVLVILTGDGEDTNDHWETRWKGEERECQYAVIPPFKNKNLISTND